MVHLRTMLLSIIGVILTSCTPPKVAFDLKQVPENALIVLGLVEYDFSGLSQKNINGIKVFLDSEEDYSELKLDNSLIKDSRLKRYEFISLIGEYGTYVLNEEKRSVASSEVSNLLTNLDMEQSPSVGGDPSQLEQFELNGGKIINIGKVKVIYSGGELINGRINYSYRYQMDYADTIAVSVFKKSYPEAYKKYNKELYFFNKKE